MGHLSFGGRTSRHVTTALRLVAGLVSIGTATAAESEAESEILGEVIVTAQFRV